MLYNEMLAQHKVTGRQLLSEGWLFTFCYQRNPEVPSKEAKVIQKLGRKHELSKNALPTLTGNVSMASERGRKGGRIRLTSALATDIPCGMKCVRWKERILTFRSAQFVFTFHDEILPHTNQLPSSYVAAFRNDAWNGTHTFSVLNFPIIHPACCSGGSVFSHIDCRGGI